MKGNVIMFSCHATEKEMEDVTKGLNMRKITFIKNGMVHYSVACKGNYFHKALKKLNAFNINVFDVKTIC